MHAPGNGLRRLEAARWPIYRSPDEAPAEERLFLADLLDNVRMRRPRLVIVNNMPTWYGLPEHFNIFDYLVHAGWTRQALAAYREYPRPGRLEGFRAGDPRGAACPRPSTASLGGLTAGNILTNLGGWAVAEVRSSRILPLRARTGAASAFQRARGAGWQPASSVENRNATAG